MASANEDTVSDSFEQWLNLQLSKLNTDQEVFGSYIKGILEGEETEDEKRDALEGILTEVTENKISELCTEIMNKWTCMHQVSGNNAKQEKREDVDTRLAKIMEKQAQSVSSGRNLSVDEKKVREAILAHYSQVSDGEGSGTEDPGGCEGGAAAVGTISATVCDSFLVKNVNAETVLQSEREKRDKNKAEVEKKKAQDKQNKEKQKQQQQERKDKEKKRTQKGERRR
ncbi:coiled-coil domain-containing protein 43-like isoform X1 [Limulus polyphemus]|uniref:Coiled-coil domain-containing protein 43 n=1 Tax=Limulus polyphemus TaxID=6850 RepID=A0ABM1BPY6_LIMPO|nr:coiled-coil domain-containing protein 43-like isoform X1 [Limulus polyphemus]